MPESKSKSVPAKKSEDALRNEAYGAAVARLRDAHREEFTNLVSEEYAARGLSYRRRLTPEEKARKVIEDQLAAFPHLREEIGAA